MPQVAFLAIGSNLGDRHRTINAALTRLGEFGVTIEAVSSLTDTAPVGGPAEQPRYLNGAARIMTSFNSDDLLAVLHKVEAELGRVRTVKDGPRTIDLDLIAFGDEIREEPGVIVPHPRMMDRVFVLEPLVEVAGPWKHPVFGKTAPELLDELRRRDARLPSPGRELTGLRAMVTGSTSGIGRAAALELANAGADVIVHGRRSRESAESVAAEMTGVRTHVLMADCGDPAACESLVNDAWCVWQGIDLWFHAAGADALTGALAKAPFPQKLETLWSVDVRGTITCARRIGRLMKQRGQGTILTIGWDQSETGMEGDSGELFAAIKGAVTMFSRSLSVSLAPEVRVNVIAPGWIKTAWGEKASDLWQRRVLRETPAKRWGLPEDIAAAVRWLASPSTNFMTGQTVRVNGGAVRA